MTDATYTAMLIVLDRSGSMVDIRSDMEGGLRQLIASQAAAPGILTVDVVTFDDQIELTHHFADPKDVTIDLVPRGSTALYDAIGWSINGFATALGELPAHARPGTVLVTIVTDGMENSSREYSASAVKKLIQTQKGEFDWDISFLGANQDAVLEAQKLGIDEADAIDYGLDAVDAVMGVHADKLTRRRGGDRTGYTERDRIVAMPKNPRR